MVRVLEFPSAVAAATVSLKKKNHDQSSALVPAVRRKKNYFFLLPNSDAVVLALRQIRRLFQVPDVLDSDNADHNRV